MERMAKKKSRKLTIFILLLVVIAGAGVYGVSLTSRPASEIDPSRLTTVQRGDLARSVVAVGKIEPISKVEIKSKANGIIKEIKVQIGDIVQEGQILVELDKENLQARLHEARAALLGAQANVKAAQAEFEKNKIEAEGVDVAFARRNRDRAEQLAKDGLIPQQNLDDSRLAVEMAQNRQRAAQSQLSITQARVSQAEAAVAQSEAAVERAE